MYPDYRARDRQTDRECTVGLNTRALNARRYRWASPVPSWHTRAHDRQLSARALGLGFPLHLRGPYRPQQLGRLLQQIIWVPSHDERGKREEGRLSTKMNDYGRMLLFSDAAVLQRARCAAAAEGLCWKGEGRAKGPLLRLTCQIGLDDLSPSLSLELIRSHSAALCRYCRSLVRCPSSVCALHSTLASR